MRAATVLRHKWLENYRIRMPVRHSNSVLFVLRASARPPRPSPRGRTVLRARTCAGSVTEMVRPHHVYDHFLALLSESLDLLRRRRCGRAINDFHWSCVHRKRDRNGAASTCIWFFLSSTISQTVYERFFRSLEGVWGRCVILLHVFTFFWTKLFHGVRTVQYSKYGMYGTVGNTNNFFVRLKGCGGGAWSYGAWRPAFSIAKTVQN
jgi:hypothetical protein